MKEACTQLYPPCKKEPEEGLEDQRGQNQGRGLFNGTRLLEAPGHFEKLLIDIYKHYFPPRGACKGRVSITVINNK